MGSLVLLTPITYVVFILGSLSLVAFPFFTGFYSKDFLLEILLVPLNITHTIAYIFTLLAAFLTSTYSIRLLMLAMYAKPHFPLTILPYVKDSPYLMTAPMLFISIGAVAFGYITHELFLGFGSSFYGQSIYTLPQHIRLLDGLNFASFEYTILALFPLFFLGLFFFSIPFTNNSIPSFPAPLIIDVPKATTTYFNSWRYSTIFDPSLMNHFNIFNLALMRHIFTLSVFIYRYLDKGLLEFFGPVGIFRVIHWLGFYIELLSTGFIPHYGFILLSYILIFSFLPLHFFFIFLIFNLYLFFFL